MSFAATAVAAGGITIAPATAKTSPKGSLSFTASGGSGTGWTWSLATNASHATMNGSTGAYQAGPTGNVIDVVQVSDSAGNQATCNVIVTPGISVTPSSVYAAPATTIPFTATGGSGAGWVWSLTTNASGGTIDQSGNYAAGATGSVTDIVQVTDSRGNLATANVTVSAGGSTTSGAAAARAAARTSRRCSSASGRWSAAGGGARRGRPDSAARLRRARLGSGLAGSPDLPPAQAGEYVVARFTPADLIFPWPSSFFAGRVSSFVEVFIALAICSMRWPG